MVTAEGGTGIPVRVDHTAEDQVVALFERVRREQNRLDVLAIVMTGQPASWKPFLDDTPAAGRTFVEGWIWPHIVTAWHGAKLMVQRRSGLIVELVEQDNVGYHGAFYFDLMETLLKRLVFGLANELGKFGLAAIAVAPGSCGRKQSSKDSASPRGVGVMRSAIRRPLQGDGADPRRHASLVVQLPLLRQTLSPQGRTAAFTQRGHCQRNTGSPMLMAPVLTMQC
jgi:NAD(P)-dependent dehydrogenase (short-subunit alcohol dehydrogenase family)